MKSSEVMIGQTWSYIGDNLSADETIKLTAKDIRGKFEYKHLFGCEEDTISYTSEYIAENWALDPEAKGSKHFRK